GLTNPANGTVLLNVNGTVTYTPNASFGGTDTFAYIASDGTTNSAAATVTVQVKANAPPVANNDTATTNKATPAIISVLANDTDANGDVLSVVALTQAANGTVLLNADKTVTYTRKAGCGVPDTF